jgi:DNA (cytosine-5)-methyltransferase 1
LLAIAANKKQLPEYLVMENVPMIISKRYMPDFQDWLMFLGSIGYINHYKDLNAKDYGIPQNRNRVFLVSILGCQNEF